MCSASTLGTDSFRPIAYWPYGLLKRAASGCQKSLRRLEKEIAIEEVRRARYTDQVSRLHGIYLWASEEDAIRCESKWRGKEGQHFDRDLLVEVQFTYSKRSRADTQWIDKFILDDTVPWDRSDLSWADSYWSGKPLNDDPHWEHLVEGRGLVFGTGLRMKALERIKTGWPNLIGQVELARLAAEIDSDLYNIAPFVFQNTADSVSVAFCLDARDENDDFMGRLGGHIKTLHRSSVNWEALELLRLSDQQRPDLRKEGFEFPLSLLSSEGRVGAPSLISRFDPNWELARRLAGHPHHLG